MCPDILTLFLFLLFQHFIYCLVLMVLIIRWVGFCNAWTMLARTRNVAILHVPLFLLAQVCPVIIIIIITIVTTFIIIIIKSKSSNPPCAISPLGTGLSNHHHHPPHHQQFPLKQSSIFIIILIISRQRPCSGPEVGAWL